MLFLLQQYQKAIQILLKNFLKKNLLYMGIFYPLGEPILLHLLCCDPFAVDNHSCMDHASHLQQPRHVNNPSKLMKKQIFSENKQKGEHI